jgi:hypothetical protein
MGVPWWAWLLVALYCAPGAYCLAVILTEGLEIKLSLPEDGEELPRPAQWWFKALLLAVGAILLLVGWPAILWRELRR